MEQPLLLHDFSYSLPEERIALFPLEQRDQAKLLVYRKGTITNRQFSDLPDTLPERSVLFFNNTRVIQARLKFEKESGASIEVFLLSPIAPSPLLIHAMQAKETCRWKCTIGNVKRWKDNTRLSRQVGGTLLNATLLNREHGEVEFTWTGGNTFAELISLVGQTPLPPYLRRDVVEGDRIRYQTVYSRIDGAVAAPTAGLHFTKNVLATLHQKQMQQHHLTLHVSAGTFQPIKHEDVREHTMHQEQIVITLDNIRALIEKSGPVIAVGTTSMRTLESIYWFGSKLITDPTSAFHISQDDPYKEEQRIRLEDALRAVEKRMAHQGVDTITGETSIYIRPGYEFRVCNGLITNFHQPGSTLILLVAAFIGKDWRTVYESALTNGYRFLSYGDSSLLLP